MEREGDYCFRLHFESFSRTLKTSKAIHGVEFKSHILNSNTKTCEIKDNNANFMKVAPRFFALVLLYDIASLPMRRKKAD